MNESIAEHWSENDECRTEPTQRSISDATREKSNTEVRLEDKTHPDPHAEVLERLG